MSNRPRHRRRTSPQRAPRADIDLGCLAAGCTCRPDVVHRASDIAIIRHDVGCPAEWLGWQYIVRLPRTDTA